MNGAQEAPRDWGGERAEGEEGGTGLWMRSLASRTCCLL